MPLASQKRVEGVTDSVAIRSRFGADFGASRGVDFGRLGRDSMPGARRKDGKTSRKTAPI